MCLKCSYRGLFINFPKQFPVIFTQSISHQNWRTLIKMWEPIGLRGRFNIFTLTSLYFLAMRRCITCIIHSHTLQLRSHWYGNRITSNSSYTIHVFVMVSKKNQNKDYVCYKSYHLYIRLWTIAIVMMSVNVFVIIFLSDCWLVKWTLLSF